MAISACPTTIADILAMAERVANEEIRIDELVDGLIDANAEDADGFSAQEAEAIESEDEEAEEEDDGRRGRRRRRRAGHGQRCADWKRSSVRRSRSSP